MDYQGISLFSGLDSLAAHLWQYELRGDCLLPLAIEHQLTGSPELPFELARTCSPEGLIVRMVKGNTWTYHDSYRPTRNLQYLIQGFLIADEVDASYVVIGTNSDTQDYKDASDEAIKTFEQALNVEFPDIKVKNPVQYCSNVEILGLIDQFNSIDLDLAIQLTSSCNYCDKAQFSPKYGYVCSDCQGCAERVRAIDIYRGV